MDSNKNNKIGSKLDGKEEKEEEEEEEEDDRSKNTNTCDYELSNSNNLIAADRQLADVDEDKNENVRVFVRCRPESGEATEERRLRRDENADGRANVRSTGEQRRPQVVAVRVSESDGSVQVGEREFRFDGVFAPDATNEQIYMRSVRRLVDHAFQGYSCTVFLYGQTATGKTFTHSSLASSAFAHLFSLIRDSDTQSRFLIRASYFELYNENPRDLLSDSDKPLELKESRERGVYLKDLSCYLVGNLNELERLKLRGDKRRATAATDMNERSSRSHSILALTIETLDATQQQSSSLSSSTRRRQAVDNLAGSAGAVRVGRLYLVDLAGSERQTKSGSSGSRLKEASRINLSLTCLSLVIRALTDSSSTHIPYRNSKLTRLLSSALGGNSKTILIACVSPSSANADETLNTLRFASRVKLIKNTAKVNEDSKDALLREYRKQIHELKQKLKREQQMTNDDDDDVVVDEALASFAGATRTTATAATTTTTTTSGDDAQSLQILRMLRDKIMVGGENLLDKLEIHDRLIAASKLELEEKRLKEAKLQQQLEQKRKTIDRMTQVKGSLEEQKADLDFKLQRALVLYKQSKEEQRDLTCDHDQLRENLLHAIRTTTKEIKYADCIIEDFIPREYLDLINTYAQYDDDSDEWQIKYIALSGNNVVQTKRITEGVASPSADDKQNIKISRSEATREDPYLRLKDMS